MAPKTETEVLAGELGAPSLHEDSRRFPAALRARAVEWARARLAAGASRAALCAEVDTGERTLHRFLGTARRSERTAGFTRLQRSSARPEPMTVTRAVVLRLHLLLLRGRPAPQLDFVAAHARCHRLEALQLALQLLALRGIERHRAAANARERLGGSEGEHRDDGGEQLQEELRDDKTRRCLGS
jgi:hypothetical protein